MGNQKRCFVCTSPLEDGGYSLNQELQLPVCNSCRGSDEEKMKAESLLDSLADGLVCGCI